MLQATRALRKGFESVAYFYGPGSMNCMDTRGFPTTGDSRVPRRAQHQRPDQDLHRRGRQGLLLPVRPVAARPAGGGPDRGRHPGPPARHPGLRDRVRPQGRDHQLDLPLLVGDGRGVDRGRFAGGRATGRAGRAGRAGGGAGLPPGARAQSTTGTCWSTAVPAAVPDRRRQPVRRVDGDGGLARTARRRGRRRPFAESSSSRWPAPRSTT